MRDVPLAINHEYLEGSIALDLDHKNDILLFSRYNKLPSGFIISTIGLVASSSEIVVIVVSLPVRSSLSVTFKSPYNYLYAHKHAKDSAHR